MNDQVDTVLNLESKGHDYDADGNILTSPKGAQAAMQVMPATQLDPGYGVTPAKDNSPEEIDRVGRDYLAAMQAKYKDPMMALAAYNAGPGAVDKAVQKGGQQWLGNLPTETQNYVKNGSHLGAGKQYAAADTGNMTDATYDNMTPEQAKAQLAALGLDENGNQVTTNDKNIATPRGASEITPDQAKAQLAALGLDENGQPVKKPDADTFGGIEQIRRQSEKTLSKGDNWAQRNLLDPFVSQENQGLATKAVRSLSSLPLGAIQFGLDNTGFGNSDVAHSIAHVQQDTDQQASNLDKNFPTHTMDFSHGLSSLVPKALQASIVGPAFEAAPLVGGALEGAGPLVAKTGQYATNIGVGGATSGALAGLEARPEENADARNSKRGSDAGTAALEGAVLPAAIPALAGVSSAVSDRLSPLLNASKRLREIVGADALSPVGEAGPQIPDFFKNIEQNSPLAASVPGYTPTTAQLAQNPGMATLERGARSPSAGPIANDLVNNDMQNKGAISDLVGSISPNAAEDVPALQETAQNALNKTTAGVQNKVTAAETAADLAQQLKQQASDQATASLPATDRAQASSSMFDKIKTLFGQDRSMKNQLFNAIDPNGEVPIASDQMKQAVTSALDNTSDEQIRDELASHPAVQKILSLPANISFKQLQEYRPLLSKYLSQARQANDGLLQNVLGSAKGALENYSNDLASGNGGWLFPDGTPGKDAQVAAGQRAKAAIDYYANTFSPRWNTGPGKAIAQGIKTYNPVAPEVAGSRFLKPGDSAAQAYRNLNEMIQGDPTLQPAAEDHILSDMQQTPGMIDENGIINPKKLDSWRQKNAELLKQVPALKDKVDSMYDSVKSASDKADDMTERLRQANADAKQQDKNLNASAVGKVLSKENAADVVGSVMNSDNPSKAMGNIVKLAASDKSGRASQGLKQATYDHLKQIITNTQTQVGAGETANVSLAKLDNYLNRPQKVAALTKVLGADEVQKLVAAREGLRLMSTLSNFQALPGSQTSANTAAAGLARRMLKGATNIATGGNASVIKDGVMQIGDALAGRTGAHLNKALVDPEYAKMLTTYNPSHPNAAALRSIANSALVPAIAGTQQ